MGDREIGVMSMQHFCLKFSKKINCYKKSATKEMKYKHTNKNSPRAFCSIGDWHSQVEVLEGYA